MRVQSLGQKGPLEKEMATHSNIRAWKTPRTGIWQATDHGVSESDTTVQLTHTHTHTLWHHNMLQIHLEFPCFRPVSSHFSKELCFLCWKIRFRTQDLGTKRAQCSWVPLLSALSADRVNRYMHTYWPKYTHLQLILYPTVSVVCQFNEMNVWSVKVTQSCLTLCDPADSSVHWIL